MILRFELITNRNDCLDVLIASQLELLPNPANMDIHGSRFSESLIPPNDVEQLVSRKNLTLVLDQKFQQTELLQGELRLAAIHSNEIGIEINVQSPIVKNSPGAVLIALVPEHRPNLLNQLL